MMKFLLALALLVTTAHAEQYLYSQQPKTAKTVASGGSPIPTTFGTGSQSRVMTGLSKYGHIIAFNSCDDAIAINFTYGTTPSNTDPANIYLPGGTGIALDNVPVGANVYIRSDSGVAITAACFVVVTVW